MIRFQKFFETTEKEAKQSTLYETGIRLDSNGRPVDYETIPSKVSTYLPGSKIKTGLPDVLAWIETPGENIHRLRHNHGWHVRLRVDPKQERWLAAIEIDPEADDYNPIKRSLENNGWEEEPVRGRRTQASLSRVLEKINEIAEKSADGDYIYRGESKIPYKVCSSLYRIRPNTEGIHFDISDLQSTILKEAKAYLGEVDDIDGTDDIEILTELQHLGGKTNLIDFTENYLIALFFACDGSPDEEGRVILLKRESDDYEVRRPRRTINRVESQRSVFVESPTGFVEPDIVVTIPAQLKQPLLVFSQQLLDSY